MTTTSALVPEEVPGGLRDLTLLQQTQESEDISVQLLSRIQKKRRSFQEVIGKLNWQGDPVEEQRRIRDGW